MAGNFPLTIETSSAIAEQVLVAAVLRPGPGGDRDVPRSGRAGDAGRRCSAWRGSCLKPDALSIVLVGDAATFVESVAADGVHRLRADPVSQLDLDAPVAAARAAARRPRYRCTPRDPTRPVSAPTTEPPDARPPRVMISCGEASGDLYAAALDARAPARSRRAPRCSASAARAWRRPAPNWSATTARFAVTGLVEALSVVPRVVAHAAGSSRRPRAIGGPTCSSPSTFPTSTSGCCRPCTRSVFPSSTTSARSSGRGGRGGLRSFGATSSKMLVIFPFEAAIYERAGVPVEFVGHPLVDLATRPAAARELAAASWASTRRGPWWRCCPAAGRTRSSDCCRCWPTRVPRIDAAGARRAVRGRARAVARRRAVRGRWPPSAADVACGRRGRRRRCWRRPTWWSPRRARRPCRRRCTAGRWSSSTGCRRSTYAIGRAFVRRAALRHGQPDCRPAKWCRS